MKEIKIEHLAYLLKQAKDKKQPQPIFFLGAGASRSGNIPLASEIIKQILKDYSDSPFIKDLPEAERTYAKLMNCLLPDQRDELLKKYIDEAKINVTHIYLAQLINEDYVDYVLTVNFDNLMLRALALFNIFPSTYDMAILKEFTTSTFKEKSVVYLHGQNHGLWLLNTPEEMEKVKNTVPRIFDTIKNKRPWVFIGYSGDDPIFEHVKNLGRFNNGFYWVTFNDSIPIKNVQKLIADPNTNAFLIKGYDSDSFMLKLNSELGLSQPNIVNKPFSALKDMLSEIVDINEKEHFKGVKERLEIAKNQVDEAIQQFELGNLESLVDVDRNKIDLLKKEIINILISQEFNEEVISGIEEKVRGIDDISLNELYSALYSDWGITLGELAITKEGAESEELYCEAFKKYQRAIDINSKAAETYASWGNDLGNLANIKKGDEAELIYQQAFEKFQNAIDIKPEFYEAYSNWGLILGRFAKNKTGKDSEDYYNQAITKFQYAIDINPKASETYVNWGCFLADLAEIKQNKDSEKLYLDAFEKFQKAIDIKPEFQEAYTNWGFYLGNFAKTKKGKEVENLYYEAFKKYEIAAKIKQDSYQNYYNWGINLSDLAEIKEDIEAQELYREAFKKYQQAIDINAENYESFCNWGTDLGNLARRIEGKEAEILFNQAFEKYEKAIEIKPDMFDAFANWGTDLGNFAKTKEGKEAEKLYHQAFQKYQQAIDINPEKPHVFNNWGNNLAFLAKSNEGKKAEEFYRLAFEKFQKAIEYGSSSYNLSCFYALQGDKENALKYLELCLSKNEMKVDFVEKDEDWQNMLGDKDFIAILNKYR